jgi:hypothetical protein
LKSHGGCCISILPECEDLFCTLELLNFPTNKRKKAENFSAQETSVSKTFGRKATKLLHLRPCNLSAVDDLKEHDPVARIQFCNRFLQSVYDGEIDPWLVFFSSEAWFCLCGEVNSQNSRYWSAENSGFIHDLPLLDETIGVRCAMSARCSGSQTVAST